MSTQDHDAARAVARARLGTQDCVDTHAQVMETEKGAYVEAWLWVPKLVADEVLRGTGTIKCRQEFGRWREIYLCDFCDSAPVYHIDRTYCYYVCAAHAAYARDRVEKPVDEVKGVAV